MKRIVNLSLIAFLPLLISAQHGKVLDNLSMESKILKMQRKYAVYLPPDYETSQRSYPVLYLLHGGGGDQAEWVQRGEVQHIADKAIDEGISTPMIIVMPDASGERRGYATDPKGEWRYEDFFFQEFIPYIEKTYRIRPLKRYRAVAGLSMGGNGTLIYALHHPEMFVAACPMSAGTSPQTLDDAKARWKKMDPKINDALIEKWYSNHNIFDLIKNIPEERKNAVKWYIDCGDDDPLDGVWEGNMILHTTMRKSKIPHEFRISDGAHTWLVWRAALPLVLEFVTNSFHN